MSGYVCAHCGKTSGTIKQMNGPDKGKEKPAMSERGCTVSSTGNHKWVKR